MWTDALCQPAAAWPRELSCMLCRDLRGGDVGRDAGRVGGKQTQAEGGVCIHVAVSRAVETNTKV